MNMREGSMRAALNNACLVCAPFWFAVLYLCLR